MILGGIGVVVGIATTTSAILIKKYSSFEEVNTTLLSESIYLNANSKIYMEEPANFSLGNYQDPMRTFNTMGTQKFLNTKIQKIQKYLDGGTKINMNQTFSIRGSVDIKVDVIGK